MKAVNAAYTSQTCPKPSCGYVSRDNRRGDAFHCRNPHWDCNRRGDVDHVAAMNLKLRIKDREISRFTPYKDVKEILNERFCTPNPKSWHPTRCQDYRSRHYPKHTTVANNGS